MKKNWLSKLLCLTLVAVMLLSMVACGNSTTTEEPGSNVSSNQGGDVPSAGEEAAVPEDITYPLTGAESLTHWTFNQPPVASVYASWKESPYHMGLQENTGVEVEWIYPVSGSNVHEAYNLLLTDAELPNMITYQPSLADAQLLGEDGVIYDLTDYLPVYAPDYWAYLNADPARLKDATSEDGRIYGVRGYYESDYNSTYIGPVIRQDWLDECGLDTPVTLEDWENVLITFKDKYNAKFAFTMKRINMGIASGVNAQASVASNVDYWYVNENGEIKLGTMEDAFREELEILHKWYDMGLLDPDSFTMDDNTLRSKVLNNEVGVSITAMSQMTNWIADATTSETGSNWVGMEYPRVAEGAATSRIQASNLTINVMTMISKNSTEEELITALKWLNYGFTDEGRMYINFGTEGETYTLDANGEPQWTDLVTADADGMAVAITKYTGAHSTPLATVQAARMVQIKNNPASAAAVYEWIENTDNGKYLMPYLSLTVDETLSYTDKYAAIKSYCTEMALKFILGEESLDDWDAYIQTLEKMGVQDCQAIQQAAYDRYLAK